MGDGSLVLRLLPSHTVQNMGREPEPFDHVRNDILIELFPTHAILERLTMLEIETESPCQSRTVTVLHAAQNDRKES